VCRDCRSALDGRIVRRGNRKRHRALAQGEKSCTSK
jgi:hypothetical protein